MYFLTQKLRVPDSHFCRRTDENATYQEIMGLLKVASENLMALFPPHRPPCLPEGPERPERPEYLSVLIVKRLAAPLRTCWGGFLMR